VRAALEPLRDVPLAPLSTLGVGGAARYLAEVASEDELRRALDWAAGRGVDVRILGGGSNLVVGDGGVDALVVKIALRGVGASESAGAVVLTASAGEPWDDVVRHAVARGWAGIECLSGIPGLVGATPIQNVGAYGQDVSQTICAVRALDRRTGRVETLEPADCGFGYRDSRFRRAEPERFVVLAVSMRLVPGGAPSIRYRELADELARREIAVPSLADARDSVLAIRRSKSMVLDPDDPNRRSCGSFFVNPVLPAEDASRVLARTGHGAPHWPEADGRVKLSAAWLIERAGLARGDSAGPVGLSTRHALAIVCHDGARARDVLAFARMVRDRVEERFGVRLAPEPVFWGIAALD
jgi:UDP-N-acetylmuramate dehydrogenase